MSNDNALFGALDVDDLSPLTEDDTARYYEGHGELAVLGTPVYVKAIEVFRDGSGTLCAAGPYEQELSAACVLSQTTNPKTVRSRDGRRWLILLSNHEEE